MWIEGAPSNILTGSTLDYVTVEYGGLGTGNGASLGVRYAEVAVRHSTFRGSARYGIYADTEGTPHVSDSTIADNAQEAILFLVGSSNPVFAPLKASGNGSDTISLYNGGLKGEHVWENAGLPYRLMPGNTIITVLAGATLTIEPGVTVLMDSNARLYTYGRLVAEGTAAAPILITGAIKEPGSWQGMTVEGMPDRPAVASMRYVTVEYGGLKNSSGANIYVAYGQLLMSHSVVRHGVANGIWLHSGAYKSVIETSQLTGNQLYAIYNVQPDRMALAANNWWGAPGGPAADDGCVSGGGARVSRGLVVAPFLSGPEAPAGAIPPSSARQLSIKPQRFFATADGRARVWVEVTLRDGAGNPLAGRKVRLQTTHGFVTDGGITDAQGRTLAYLTAAQPGDATINAVIDGAETCEFARSAEARVTFTPDPIDAGLMPESAAPYLSGGISIAPEPLTRGVPATLSAQVSNPGDAPIVVEGTFAFAQQGIGLVFGPISTQQLTIPPRSTVSFSTPFTPPIEGHFCFRFEYSIVSAGDELAHLRGTAAAFRVTGDALLEAPMFAPAAAGASLAAEAGGSNLALAGELRETIVIGNPFATETTLELRLRPMDLPPDWAVALSQSSLTLKPGEQREVTVTITPGTAVQGTAAQVAVEGYAGGQLVDGVALEVVVPEQQPFDGRFSVMLPLIRR